MLLPESFEFLRRVKGVIGIAAAEKLICVPMVYLLPVTLPVWCKGAAFADTLIDLYSGPLQGVHYVLLRSLNVPCLVCVFNPQNEGPAMVACKEIIIKCCSHTAYVQRAGGTWGKSNPNLSVYHILNL